MKAQMGSLMMFKVILAVILIFIMVALAVSVKTKSGGIGDFIFSIF